MHIFITNFRKNSLSCKAYMYIRVCVCVCVCTGVGINALLVTLLSLWLFFLMK